MVECEQTTELINGCQNKWINQWVLCGCMDKWLNDWTAEWINEWSTERMNKWINEWMIDRKKELNK